MPINWRSGAPLLEIKWRAHLVAELVEGVTYERYLDEPQRQATFERHLEVIGEAFNRIARADEETAARIEKHQGFIGLRNVIDHGYDRLVQSKIWDAVTEELPAGALQVATLLEEFGEPR